MKADQTPPAAGLSVSELSQMTPIAFVPYLPGPRLTKAVSPR